MVLPKPPIKTMTDFVVFCFVTVVSVFLIGTGTTLLVFAFLNPKQDFSQVLNVLFDIMTTLIGSLIGFIAGKGQGRSEVREEQVEQLRQIYDETQTS